MNRRNTVLLTLLLVQAVIIAVVYWPRADHSAAEAVELLPQAVAQDAAEIRITDENNGVLELVKKESGWVLPKADEYPADQEKVKEFLGKLAGLSSSRLVTRTGSSHRRLKVDDKEFIRLVEIKKADGTAHKLYMGTSPSYKTIHVRSGNADSVYLANELYAWEAGVEPGAWWNRQYVSVPADKITKVTLRNGQGSFAVQKEENKWVVVEPAGLGPAAEQAMSDFLAAASSVVMTESLGRGEKAEYAIATPKMVMALQTADDETTLAVGAEQDGGSSFVAKSSQSPYYVRIAKTALQALLEKKATDLVAAPAPADDAAAGGEATPPGAGTDGDTGALPPAELLSDRPVE